MSVVAILVSHRKLRDSLGAEALLETFSSWLFGACAVLLQEGIKMDAINSIT